MLSVQKKKTILRTIRITDDLDRLLRKEAEEKGTNVNGLLNAIIKQYAELDRYAERFGYVRCPRTMFRYLIESLDEEKLQNELPKLGSEVVKGALLIWFGKVNEKGFLELLSRAGKYSGFFSFEHEIDGRNYTLTFRHDLGPRWSTVMKEAVSEIVRNVSAAVPRAETSENCVAVSFTLPKT